MKKIIVFLLAVSLLTNSGCNSKRRMDDKGNPMLEFKVDKSYILLPVEEISPEVKMHVGLPGEVYQPTFNIHIAQHKPDYWVTFNVKKFQGKTVTLTFEGIKDADNGLDEIKLADKLDFEYNETYRPQFHFTPEHGWMNDPNGMVFLDGEYHVFYQYNPYGSMSGNMHWGHAVSADMVSWTYLPVAIAPDSLGLIFSGSIVVDINNTSGFGRNAMVAIYTSAGKVQAQSIAYSTDKGRTFTKYAHNPVLHNPGIVDFRDPKVSWNEISKQWIMALATKQTITFYGSPNLKDWTKLSEFGHGLGSHDGVWECPDLFPLPYQGKIKWVLLVSINPGSPNGGSSTQYFIGNFDGKKFTADALPYPLWLDNGRDNYAGVTFGNIPKSDGRRIFMGWMSNWDYANQVPTLNFRSAMTVPRELTLVHNGEHLILKGFPVKEVNSLRGKGKTVPNQAIKKMFSINELFPQNKGAYEIEMTLKPLQSKYFGFELRNSQAESLKFSFNLISKKLTINRENSGKIDFNAKFKSASTSPLVVKGTYHIRLLVDKSSAELFVNSGETAMTTLFFPTETMNKLDIFSSGGSLKAEQITVYTIK